MKLNPNALPSGNLVSKTLLTNPEKLEARERIKGYYNQLLMLAPKIAKDSNWDYGFMIKEIEKCKIFLNETK
jgi:hypothetical protein